MWQANSLKRCNDYTDIFSLNIRARPSNIDRGIASLRLLVISRVLITNTYNRDKFTTPISEEEVSVSAILIFFKGGTLLAAQTYLESSPVESLPLGNIRLPKETQASCLSLATGFK